MTSLRLAALGLASGFAAAAEPGFYPQSPSLSPDAEFVVFSWAGDLWSAKAEGGPATRLTSHPADELASAFSPDGKTLAFESNREGAKNIYLADLSLVGGTLVAGEPRRLTTIDAAHNLAEFTPAGDAVLFGSFQERDIYREERMYRAPLDGGPITRLTDAFGEHPSMSPGGDAIVFARGGNNGVRPAYRGPAAAELWRLSTADGSFTRLTNDRFDDIQPNALRDGSVVFLSSRDGQYNLWRLPAKGDARQLTSFKPADGQATIAHGVRDLSVSRDGSTAVFAVWDTLYTLSLSRSGATPREIPITVSGDTDNLAIRRIDLDREATEAALSPDGKTMAVVARGEIFVRSTSEDHPTRRVTFSESREQHIAWSPDGARLYFSSDMEGPPSLYAATVSLARQDLEPKPEPEEPKTEEPSAEPEPAGEEGDADAAPSDTDEEATDEKGEKSEEKDKKDKGPTPGERWEQALRFEISPILVSEHRDSRPTPSPEGDELLFVRNLGDLMLLDLEDGSLTTIFEGWNEPEVIWAADGDHIVYSVQDLKFNSDIFLLDLDAFEADPASDAARPINITRHPDLDVSPRLSRDGKVLYFLSDRDSQNWDFDVYAVFLDKSLETLPDYELAQHFKDAAKEFGGLKPVDPIDFSAPADDEAEDNADGDEAESEDRLKFDTGDAFLRVRRLTSIPAAEGDLAITPSGNRVVFSSSIDGERGLYSVDYAGKERKSITTGGVSSVSTSLTGDKVVFVKGGQANTSGPEGGKTETLALDAPVSIDTAAERRFKFREAARVFGDTFYHPTLKDLDWAAITARYEQLALKTRTSQEFTRVLATMFGEVNGSHTGSWGGEGYSAPSPRTGMLAIDTRPVGAGYEVVRVLRDGPADKGDKGLLAGDLITAINGEPLDRQGLGLRDLNAAMAGTSGSETLVTVTRTKDGIAETRHLLLVPHSQGAESNMRYRDEVERREALVHQLSGGRLGYLHIRGMSEPSVRDYERDLYAAAEGREGLIIDVRDNGGGWTTDILLASLTAPAHAYTIPRGADPAKARFDDYPRDRRLIHAWQRPISVLMNENSYSNAEIFSHSIKTAGRGKLVGTETHGAVISTGAHTLIDGTVIRIPFRGWYLPDGRDMDVYGAVPDIDIPMLPSDEAAGQDPQLNAAVQDLLGRLDRGEN